MSLLFRPFALLVFSAPKYETGEDWGRISWPITHGLLVAKQGRGSQDSQLEIEVHRVKALPDGGMQVSVEVEVTNFYPLFHRICPWPASYTLL